MRPQTEFTTATENRKQRSTEESESDDQSRARTTENPRDRNDSAES